MLKLLIKALGIIAGIILSGAVHAVGMGGINVTTALGEPLNAEIELVTVGKSEKGSLSARMASPEVFKGAGLDYPASIPKLKFQIETRANGEPYVKITSAQPVNEPFVNMLVELSWSSGRLLREYTFLLDPPGFKPEQPKEPEVQPVPSEVAEPVKPVATSANESKGGWLGGESTMRATAPMDEKVFAESPSADKTAQSGNVASGAIKVKYGDTLNKIAKEVKPADISLERMLVALYRANSDAFDGENMNRLRTGKILHVPENSTFDQLAQVEAVKEIHAQATDWHSYRQKLAAASGAVAEHASGQETSGKISTTVTDKAPAAKESASEVVRLSKGEAPGDKAAAGAKALQDKIHALEEEAIARSKALNDSNERIAMLEKNIKEMQRLIELKGQPVAPAKPEKAEVSAEVKPEPAKVATQAPATPVAVAEKPARKPKPAAPKVVTPPSSMLDEILGEPLYLAGGAIVVLGLAGLGIMLSRRGKGAKADKRGKHKGEEVGSTHISAPVAPSPETGDFTQTATIAPVTLESSEEVDPITEADLFLNFGRDVQAEEILKDALEKDPTNNRIRLKLLSIYANRKDTKTFAGIARQVQDSGDAVAWAQAAEMGRMLEPNNPMYGGEGSEEITMDTELPVKDEQPAGLDFDLGFEVPESSTIAENTAAMDVPLSEETGASSSVDFDLGVGETAPAAAIGESTMIMQLENPPTGPETPLDLDITAKHPTLSALEPESVETPAPELEDLIFDITSTNHPPSVEETEEETAEPAPANVEDTLAFTLDFPVTDKVAPTKPATENEVVDIGLEDIDLNLDESATGVPAAEVKGAHWHDVATKIDLAKAYQEMGDAAGAKEILEEVLNEGDDQQRATAEAMMQQLSA